MSSASRHEAAEAARVLRTSWRDALDIPDGRVENTWENRLKVARVIRQTRPRVLILPYWDGRHPDHYTASKLGYEAGFLAGLAKVDIDHALDAQHSAFSQVASAVASVAAGEKQLSSGAGSALKATPPIQDHLCDALPRVDAHFVVDITDQFELRLESLMAYKSQFGEQEAGKDIFPARAEIRARVESMARFYGSFAGVTYAEPFLQKEIGPVEDLTALPVKSI